MTQELERRYLVWLKDTQHTDDVLDFIRAELQKAAEIAKKEADGFYVDAAKFEHPSPIYTSLAKRGDVASHIERDIRKLME